MASIEGAPQQGDEVNKSSSAATGNVCNSATIGQGEYRVRYLVTKCRADAYAVINVVVIPPSLQYYSH